MSVQTLFEQAHKIITHTYHVTTISELKLQFSLLSHTQMGTRIGRVRNQRRLEREGAHAVVPIVAIVVVCVVAVGISTIVEVVDAALIRRKVEWVTARA